MIAYDQKIKNGDNSIAMQAGRDINLYGNTKEDFGIISDIVEYIIKRKKSNDYFLEVYLDNPDLLRKISLNFENEEKEEVTRKFKHKRIMYLKNLFEQYLESMSETRGDDVEDLKLTLQDDFQKIKNVVGTSHKIDQSAIFLDIADKIIPEKKLKDPRYKQISYAIVYYFFEICDIGLKP